MPRTRNFMTGWCAAGNCQHCHGAVRSPSQESGMVVCSHSCHKGQEISLPEEYVKPVDPRQAFFDEVDEWFSQMILHQRVTIPTTKDEYGSIAARMRKVAGDANVEIQTRYNQSEGVLRVNLKGTHKNKKGVTVERQP